MRAVPIVAICLIASTAAPTATALLDLAILPPGPSLVVGFEPGDLPLVSALVEALGGEVTKAANDAGIAVVEGPVTLQAGLSLSALLLFVETNDLARAASAEWNGAEWNSVEWNGAEWNGVEWNGAEWNGNGAGADPGTGFQWGLERVHAKQAWAQHAGARRADLCVVDSGLDKTHRDVAANAGPGWNAIDLSSDYRDDGGHGTHVGSIAAGVIGNGYGIAGVGNVRLLTAKALAGNGTGLEGDVALGIAWCAAQGADVILLALSSSPSPGIERAVAFATSRDAVIVASAGNTGPCVACVGFPAELDLVVAVSAIDATGLPALFSAGGPQVDLAAPGVSIAGAIPGGKFAYGSGTSQAAAFVAGVAALARDADPTLSAAATRQLLYSTAEDLGVPGRDPTFGHGLVDAGAAVAAALG